MTQDRDTRDGLVAGLGAYLIWGFLPVYFVYVASVNPLEVLAHRVIWAVPFGAMILAVRHQWAEVKQAITTPRTMTWLVISALFIGGNWLVYIWAIGQGRILETSLGYYINPLIHVLAGVVLLGERLRKLQVVAVVLATIGVGVLTVRGGQVPWVALTLAFSFAAYAVIRKQINVGAMPGLFVETSMMFPLALVWLGFLMATGQAAFGQGNSQLGFWLVMGGPITAFPLLCFAIAARKLPLTTIGFMQFIAPTIQFCTGLYFGEKLTTPHIICFAFIWTAVCVFSYDAIRSRSKNEITQ